MKSADIAVILTLAAFFTGLGIPMMTDQGDYLLLMALSWICLFLIRTGVTT